MTPTDLARRTTASDTSDEDRRRMGVVLWLAAVLIALPVLGVLVWVLG